MTDTAATNEAGPAQPLLFEPLKIRGVNLKNRLVISPMCTYSAEDGVVTDWHFAHLSGFAMGGAGLVFTEATAVSPEGRITHGDTGLWSDAQIDGWRPITKFLKDQGAAPAMQIGHAGRKASMQRPWHGNGPMDDTDAARGEVPWNVIAPSPIALDDGWLVPRQLDQADMNTLSQQFADTAKRALEAGFEAIEVHSAHGYLLQTFLSPLGNKRNDAFGGDLEGRMRFPLQCVEAVRAAWPEDKPLFVRISSVDGIEGGWTIEDSLLYASALRERGVDVIDCSSGGQSAKGATNANLARGPGFQVPFAERIRAESDIMTQAVGLILSPEQAEEILQEGRADLVAIGREALEDPFWPNHAAYKLRADRDFEAWTPQYGWWLNKREDGLRRSGIREV